MSGLSFFRLSTALAFLALGTGCAELETAQRAASNAARSAASAFHPHTVYWNERGATGPRKIVVDLGDQRAYFFRGKRVIGESTISTGKKGYETPPGRYSVIEKDQHNVSSIYGAFVGKDGRVVRENVSSRKDKRPPGTTFVGAKMPYFLRFTGGYGMHAGYVPRYRASHGCIRMPQRMAKHFFDTARLGTPVIVKK